jgi:uncharacterized protein (DUF2147 family)
MPVLALIAALAGAAPAAAADTSLEGVWRSPGGNTIMKIAACGDTECGTVAWASDKAKKDSSKATTQLVGTALLTALKQDKKGRWQGKLFIPDQNMRATAKLERVSADQLKVSGCAAGKMLCKTQIWTAFNGPLPGDTSVPAPK